MVGIFISYRRKDSEGYAGRLHDHLSPIFGEQNLFLDVDNIDAGDDFVAKLERAVASSRVMLVVMGPDWLDLRDNNGARRIDNPLDFVHIEVRAALERGLVVIPVLVGGTSMPRQASLPEVLRPLAQRQAVEIQHKSFRQDVEALAMAIRRIAPNIRPQESRPHRRATLYVTLVWVAVVVLFLSLSSGTGTRFLLFGLDPALGAFVLGGLGTSAILKQFLSPLSWVQALVVGSHWAAGAAMCASLQSGADGSNVRLILSGNADLLSTTLTLFGFCGIVVGYSTHAYLRRIGWRLSDLSGWRMMAASSIALAVGFWLTATANDIFRTFEMGTGALALIGTIWGLCIGIIGNGAVFFALRDSIFQAAPGSLIKSA